MPGKCERGTISRYFHIFGARDIYITLVHILHDHVIFITIFDESVYSIYIGNLHCLKSLQIYLKHLAKNFYFFSQQKRETNNDKLQYLYFSSVLVNMDYVAVVIKMQIMTQKRLDLQHFIYTFSPYSAYFHGLALFQGLKFWSITCVCE